MIALTVTQSAACAYVLLACVLILNKMSHATRISIMIPFILLTVSSGTGLVTAVAQKGNFTECGFAVGVALFLAFNGRVRNVS